MFSISLHSPISPSDTRCELFRAIYVPRCLKARHPGGFSGGGGGVPVQVMPPTHPCSPWRVQYPCQWCIVHFACNMFSSLPVAVRMREQEKSRYGTIQSDTLCACVYVCAYMCPRVCMCVRVCTCILFTFPRAC